MNPITLKSNYKTLAEIPEGFAALYTEQNDRFEITGVEEIETSRRQISELALQLATDENATRARIAAAVIRVTRDIRAPTFLRSCKLVFESIRRATSKFPLGDDVHNPWSPAGWNITEQGRYFRQHGAAAAEEAAKSVGTYIGATRPTLSQDQVMA